jgi:hypothetical protein
MESLTRLIRAIFQNATQPLSFISVNVSFLTPLYEYIELSISQKLHDPGGPPIVMVDSLPSVYVDINREGQVLFSLEPSKLRCPHLLAFHYGGAEARAKVYNGDEPCRAELRFTDTDDGLHVDFLTDIPYTADPSEDFTAMAYRVNKIVEDYKS